MTTLPLTNSISRARLRCGVLLIALLLTCLAFSPSAQAVDPPPDGGYPNQNTAEGNGALANLTTGDRDTAVGFHALATNTSGSQNTAVGAAALQKNTIGAENTAVGVAALEDNTTGFANVAIGIFALSRNTSGLFNTATGLGALAANTTGHNNTANGGAALIRNISGSANTADGFNALDGLTVGQDNIALGFLAGSNLVDGNENIYIGNAGGGPNENEKIRIGQNGTHRNTFIAGISGVTVPNGVGVVINGSGQLGTITSSERYKDEIRPMDKASEAILALKPVTFRYKKELDPEETPQFGLVAEEVEKVDPDLVARDEEGRVYTVRYEAVNAMLLNEFLKQHRQVQDQQKQIAQLTAQLKEQAAQIRKVNNKLEMSKPGRRLVNNQ